MLRFVILSFLVFECFFYHAAFGQNRLPKTKKPLAHKERVTPTSQFILSQKQLTRFDYIIEKTENTLEKDYYALKPFNDSFSAVLFKTYLNDIDNDKLIFFQSDIDALKKYEYTLDNEWNTKQYHFLVAVDSIYNIRSKENKRIVFQLLDTPITFSSIDSFNSERNSVAFLNDHNLSPKAKTALRQKAWKQYLKYMMIDRYENEMARKKKNSYVDSLGHIKSKDTSYVIKADSVIEKDVRKKITKIFTKLFERVEKRFNIDEKFNIYINTILETLDPHTSFLPPAEKRSFDESMKKKFYGIGAQLREDDNGIKIEKLLLGGAALKSKKILAGDIILRVGQGNDTLVDMMNYETTEAVKLIRGDQGTVVTLEIKHLTGEIETIKIVREEVKTDETLVKSAIIEEDGYKIGFLYVPEFYADFGDAENGSQSYIDAATEIEKLKKENIDGIVIDLRNNGGGSLHDVVQMAGFFISSGPIVQIKNKQGRTSTLEDKYKWILYPGPMTIMVNELSASASEIFAAAMQDYQRGIVVGNTTYGKGTVQTTKPLGLPPNWNDTAVKEMGTIKLSIQKFYRINGNSTQRLGVVPDIIFPSRLEYLKIKENDNINAMPYDQIASAEFKPWMYSNFDKTKLIENANTKIAANPYFKAIKENTKTLFDLRNLNTPLQLDSFVQQKQHIKHIAEKIDSSVKQYKDSINVNLMAIDKQKFKEEDKNQRNQEWAKNLRKDIQLIETVSILKEMIGKKMFALEQNPKN